MSDEYLSHTCRHSRSRYLSRMMKQQNSSSNSHLLRTMFGTLLLCILLAGCGPELAPSNSDSLIAETEKIAQNYAASNNLDAARDALNGLDVANAKQWLIYVTESNISQNQNPDLTDALMQLTLDLGLSSNSIEARGIATGLIAPTPVVAPPPPAPVESTEQVAIVQPQAAEEAAPRAGDAEQPEAQEAAAPESPAEAPAAPTEVPAEEPKSPQVAASDGINVRSGPGTAFPIVGALEAGEIAAATGKSPAGDWWQVLLNSGEQGWVFSQLVTTSGAFDNISVPANIPEPPPTPVPTPVPPTATPEPVVEEAPPEPPRSGSDFALVERRLWSAAENGGRMDGQSVVCGEKRELHVTVVDAAGNLLNGVAVQAQYGAKEIYVTGSQGKGEGKSEFVLGDGQDVKVVKDVDGRDVSSDLASGLVTVPYQIPFGDLIAAGYCTDDASCQKNVVDPYACGGHFSWSVKFQRGY